MHQAKLFRHDGIDVNFRVQIDPEAIYYSPMNRRLDLSTAFIRRRPSGSRGGFRTGLQEAGHGHARLYPGRLKQTPARKLRERVPAYARDDLLRQLEDAA